MAKRREIEAAKLNAGFCDDLSRFLADLAVEIGDTPHELIFNADESMLSGKRQYKGVIGNEEQVAIGPEHQDRQYMTAMVTVCASGANVPLSLFLSGLQHMPETLSFAGSRCWIASSSNGWMTKYLFLDYAINFCHWLSFYRLSLPEDMRTKPAVLLLDGHATRLNPAAMEYFRRFNVKIITLPPHSTHILQPFDVGIASAFKVYFKKSMMRIIDPRDRSRDTLRAATVAAALDAYDASTTFTAVKGAFARACIVPCFAEPLWRNPYVRPGSSPNPPITRGYNISSKNLTNEIQDMVQYLRDKRDPHDSTMMIIDAKVQCSLSLTRSIHEGRLLVPYHTLLQFTREQPTITEFK